VAQFLLVHGAWHGGWCFDRLARELERRGHTVEAPDLPCDEVGLTVFDHARLLGPHPDAVVVGHSLAGLAIPFVDARVRVYLAALLPLAGIYDDALLATFGGALRDELDRSYWPDPDVTFAKLYPDCSRADSDLAYAQLRPQARIEPVETALSADDVFVVTRRDAAVDPAWQQRVPRTHLKRFLELDSGHSPFFTHPVELADLLESVV
jgi:hypothetical protein